MMFTGIYGKAALDTLGVINDQPANSRPDILLLLLRAPTNKLSPFSPTRLTS